MSFTAFIHASSCCLSASNEPLTTGCTTLTEGWVTRFRPTGGTDVYEWGRMGPTMLLSPDFFELIFWHSWCNPGISDVGNWNSEIPVPWKDELAVRDVGLWSKLSRAATVKICRYKFVGKTISAFFLVCCLRTWRVDILTARLQSPLRKMKDHLNFSLQMDQFMAKYYGPLTHRIVLLLQLQKQWVVV